MFDTARGDSKNMQRVVRYSTRARPILTNRPPLLGFLLAVFIDGYFRLTDIAAQKKFPMQAAPSVATVSIGWVRAQGK